jgi:nicotinamidase-related amidase
MSAGNTPPEYISTRGSLKLFLPFNASCLPRQLSTRHAIRPSHLSALLKERHADGLVITGAETDVCVLATVLGAVDRGYRVIIVSDGVCSVSDEHHDSLLDLYRERFSQQIETADSEMLPSAWPRSG